MLVELRAILAVSDFQKGYPMKYPMPIVIASLGVFLGSLLSDLLLGDGIHSEDVEQAVLVALIAAAIQWWLLTRKR